MSSGEPGDLPPLAPLPDLPPLPQIDGTGTQVRPPRRVVKRRRPTVRTISRADASARRLETEDAAFDRPRMPWRRALRQEMQVDAGWIGWKGFRGELAWAAV